MYINPLPGCITTEKQKIVFASSDESSIENHMIHYLTKTNINERIKNSNSGSDQITNCK